MNLAQKLGQRKRKMCGVAKVQLKTPTQGFRFDVWEAVYLYIIRETTNLPF